MFRPFRPSLETLEKREVFSAGPLDSVAALGDQPIALNNKNEVAIETLEVSVAREQQRPDGIRVQSLVVDPRNTNVVYLAVTRPFADGLVLELGQRQITATYNGDTNFSAVFEPNDERPWLAAARDGAPNGVTSGYGVDFNPTVDQAASQSSVLGLDVWEHAVTDRDSVVATDFNNDGRPDLAIQSPRDAASGLPTGVRSLLPYMEQDNVYRSSPAFTNTTFDDKAYITVDYLEHATAIRNFLDAESERLGDASDQMQVAAHDAIFAELGTFGDALPRGAGRNQIIAVLIG